MLSHLRGAEGRRPSFDSLVEALERAATSRAPFVTFHDEAAMPIHLDARDALDKAACWATTLLDSGVQSSEPVAIVLPTSADFVAAFLGAVMIGAPPIALAGPMMFGSLDKYACNIARVIRHAGARTLVTSSRVADALRTNTDLRQCVRAALTPADVARRIHIGSRARTIDPSDVAFLQYTSGTLGNPKGVAISHRAITSNTHAIAQALAITSSDVGVSWLPMHHDMGLVGVLLTALCHSYPIHVMRPESFVMRPSRWMRLLSDVGGTITAAPNFAYELCCRKPMAEGASLASCRLALFGAEPVHATTVKRFLEYGDPQGLKAHVPAPVYGLAECTLAVTIPDLQGTYETLLVDRKMLETERRAAVGTAGQAHDTREMISVGKPVQGTEIRITDENGVLLDEDLVGEVRVASDSVMNGYYHDDQATDRAIVDGWLRTGDLGFVHDGRLFISGRAKDIIFKGGRNLYPYEIEQAASALANATGAAAFGVSNAQTGTDDLVLVIESRAKTQHETELLVKGVQAEIMASVGVHADRIEFCAIGQLPRTTSGKIRRRECARIFAEGGRLAHAGTSRAAEEITS